MKNALTWLKVYIRYLNVTRLLHEPGKQSKIRQTIPNKSYNLTLTYKMLNAFFRRKKKNILKQKTSVKI